jgi:hypothetical protein
MVLWFTMVLYNVVVFTSFFVLLIVSGGQVNERVYRCAKMKLIGSKMVKGARAEVYSIASKHGGMYNNSQESIYYSGEDLIVKILFERVTGVCSIRQ